MNFIKYILFLIPTVIYSQNDQWSVYMTPSEVHKQLSDYIGKFDIEVKMWMETSKEPMIVTEFVKIFHQKMIFVQKTNYLSNIY